MRHDFTPPEPSPLTPEQMAATLGLLDDVDTHWDSAVNFKECFAYQIGQMAGIITDITGDIKDGWEAQLDKED